MGSLPLHRAGPGGGVIHTVFRHPDRARVCSIPGLFRANKIFRPYRTIEINIYGSAYLCVSVVNGCPHL